METFDVRSRITELLRERGMTNAQLAQRLGCDRRTVAYWNNHDKAFKSEMLLNVCNAFSITPNEFFKVEDRKDKLSDTLVSLKKLDASVLRKKLRCLREQEFLIELALHAQQQDIQELLGQSLEKLTTNS